MKHFQCDNCGQIIEIPQGVSKALGCPKCGARAQAYMIHRLDPSPPGGRRGRGGRFP